MLKIAIEWARFLTPLTLTIILAYTASISKSIENISTRVQDLYLSSEHRLTIIETKLPTCCK